MKEDKRGALTRAPLMASLRGLCLRRVSGANTIFCHPPLSVACLSIEKGSDAQRAPRQKLVTRHFFPRPALLAKRTWRNFDCVTAVEIIAEIEHLPADERAKVVAFAQHLGESAMLPGAELSKLAGRLAYGPHPAEAARLREEIEKGFYGASSHA